MRRAAGLLVFAVSTLQFLTAGCGPEGSSGTTSSSSSSSSGDAGAGGNGGAGSAGAGGGENGGAGGGAAITPILWARSADHGGFSPISGLAVDTSGNVLLTGGINFQGGADWGPPEPTGSGDVLLMKLAANDGTALWGRRFVANTDSFSDVATDASGNVALAGIFNGSADFGGSPIIATGMEREVLLAKYDENGTHLWSKGFGPGLVPFVEFDSNGNLVLLTRCSGTNDFGGGPLSGNPLDMCVAKFDPAGTHLWSKRFAVSGDGQALGLAVDTKGNVIFCGYLQESTDFGGGPIGTKMNRQGIVVKLSADGSHVWSKAIGGQFAEFVAIAVDTNDKIVVVGSHEGTTDFGGGNITSNDLDLLVASFDDTGAYVYARTYGTNLREFAYDVDIEANGDALVAGVVQNFETPFDGGNVVILEVSPNGTLETAREAGGMDVQSAEAVAAGATGEAYVGGRFGESLAFDTTVLKKPHDAFLVRIR